MNLCQLKSMMKNLVWKRIFAFWTQGQSSMKTISIKWCLLQHQNQRRHLERILFMKCSDHVFTSSDLWLDENAQCLPCIKLESLQTLKPGVLPVNWDMIFINVIFISVLTPACIAWLNYRWILMTITWIKYRT